MGWKGTVRSLAAASRAAERNSKRRHRELQQREKEYAKMQVLEQAAYDVDAYENYIERFLSIHKDCGEGVNWNEVRNELEPIQPISSSALELKAKEKEIAYQPNFIDRLLRSEKRKRNKLAVNVQQAIAQDDKTNVKAMKDWKEAHNEWSSSIKLAEGVLNGDPKAKLEVIEHLQPFSELAELGSKLTFRVHDNGLLECDIHAHGSQVIPCEVKYLLSSGKLSIKKMPPAKFNELFQDYVCGCALRIANELFSILPGEIVLVTVIDNILNTTTGHLEQQPILSVAISRSTLSSLNLQTIDPSDSMSNFVNNMAFKKATGFLSVARVNLENLQ